MGFKGKYKTSRGYPTKRYPHFDKVIRFSEVKSYVRDPGKVAIHSFFPLIHYVIKSERCFRDPITARPKIKIKKRDIMYAAHLDGYIYRYYADRLNAAYDRMAAKFDIDSVAIAYRDNKSGMSNIQFAREVFSFIVSHPRCFIRVGDFEHFFDTLNHAYLKNQIKKVLKCELFPQDWYRVLQSVMRYSYIDREVIAPFYDKRSKHYFKSSKDYRKFRQEHVGVIKKNQKEYGIPQGTALSGVLANIYMLDVDRKIQQIVQSYGGLYRRYSDDTIIVIPMTEETSMAENSLDVKIQRWIDEAHLTEQKDKTKRFIYQDGVLCNDCNSGKKACIMDYLGFTFDGKIVKVRQKSIYKFERKACAAIHHAAAIKKRKHLKKLPLRGAILRCYFPKGHKQGTHKSQSNFLTYLRRVTNDFRRERLSCEPEQQVAKLKRKINNLYYRENKKET
ncbi:MAG: reverse transcriptase domain-containing protein [Selenomonas bovis]|nr:reverse transcriptase domain-containing protein [Selenomonas bovis]